MDLEARAAGTDNPLHKQLLTEVRNHMEFEIKGDLEPLMGTLIAEPDDNQVDALHKIRLVTAVIPALLDLAGATAAELQAVLMGGAAGSFIGPDQLDLALTFEDARAAVDAGFETLKVKVGKDPALDIERIKAIYAAIADRALIRLDANQGWTPKQAVSVLRSLEESGVRLELVEQPVSGEDVDGMKYVTDRVHTPVMADESSFGPREAIELIPLPQ